MASVVSTKESCYGVSEAARHMYGRSLLADRQPRCNRKRLLRGWRRPEESLGQLTNVKPLIKKVSNPRKPLMTKPPRMHLISEIPEPAA